MRKLQVAFALGILFNTISSHGQIIGSRENGRPLPTTVKPTELTGGSYEGNVNMFTGTYNSSYTLGTVSTPTGPSFSLQLSYSSTYAGGDNIPVLSGIPFGEGWGLNVPSISVSYEDYKTHSRWALASYFGQSGLVEDNLRYDRTEGSLFFYAPQINIPGVISGRAVFKYRNEGVKYFVLHEFDRSAEIVLIGDSWEITLDDGTVYEFRGKESFRAAPHKRSFQYGSFDPENLSGADELKIDQMTRPKGEIVEWVCTGISHKNKPNRQAIAFEYEEYGKFNYFKEYDQSEFRNAYNTVILDYGGISGSGSLPDFEIAKDLVLKRVVSYDTEGPIEQIVLDYATQNPSPTFNPSLLLVSTLNPSVKRLDSLYNYKSVFYQGVYDSNSPTYQPVDGATSNFSGWKRFLHIKHDDLLSHGIDFTTPFNPYKGSLNGSINYFFEDNQGGSNGLPFDHGFLQSPRMNNLNQMVPGDIYEVRTVLDNDKTYCAFDIAISAGKQMAQGLETPFGSGLFKVPVTEYEEETEELIFSTFGSSVKWAVTYNGSSTPATVTSNFFSMPNLPLGADYDGYSVKIGPGNSDNYMSAEEEDLIDYGTANNLPDGMRTYPSFFKTTTGNLMGRGLLSSENIPANFGIGFPWNQLSCLRSYNSGDFSFNNSGVHQNWYNTTNPQTSNFGWQNIPTLAGPSAELLALEMIRYSKNPYMLKTVSKYKTNGVIDNQTDPGIVLVSKLEMEYEYFERNLVLNKFYDFNETLLPDSRKAAIIALKNIKEVPVDPANQQLVNIPSSKYPVTSYSYTNFGFTNTVLNPTLQTNGDGLLLTSVKNVLGGITNISYYNIEDPETRILELNRWQQLTGTQAPKRGVSKAIQLTFAVKEVEKITQNGAQKWDYYYNNPESIKTHPEINIEHFEQSSTRSQHGFLISTVVNPPAELNGARPFAKHFYYGSTAGSGLSYSHNHLFGKLNKIEYYNDYNNTQPFLQKIENHQYTVIKAHENALHRPNGFIDVPYEKPNSSFDSDYLKYPYKDYRVSTCSTTPNPGCGVTYSSFGGSGQNFSVDFCGNEGDYIVRVKAVAALTGEEIFSNAKIVNTSSSAVNVIPNIFGPESVCDNTTNFTYEIEPFSVNSNTWEYTYTAPNGTITSGNASLISGVPTITIPNSGFSNAGAGQVTGKLAIYEKLNGVLKASGSREIRVGELLSPRVVGFSQISVPDRALTQFKYKVAPIPGVQISFQTLGGGVINSNGTNAALTSGTVGIKASFSPGSCGGTGVATQDFLIYDNKTVLPITGPNESILPNSLGVRFSVPELPNINYVWEIVEIGGTAKPNAHISSGRVSAGLLEAPFYTDFSEDYLSSFFVTERRKVVKEFEEDVCGRVSTGPGNTSTSFNRTSAGPTLFNPITSGHINKSAPVNGSLMLDSIESSPSYLHEMLLSGPLSDPILKGLINRTDPYPADSLASVFFLQKNLSDSVIFLLLRYPYLDYDIKFEIINQKGLVTDFVLDSMLILGDSLTENNLLPTLLNQPYLSTQIVNKLLDNLTIISEGGLYEVLLRQPYLDSSQIIRLIDLPDTDLSDLAKEEVLLAQPLINDATLLHLMQSNLILPESQLIAIIEQLHYYPHVDCMVALINKMDGVSYAYSDEAILEVIKIYETLPAEVETALSNRTIPIPVLGPSLEVDKPLSLYGDYCAELSPSANVSTMLITDYFYYDADFSGNSVSQGYQTIMGISSLPIKLKHEPSWQLYKKKVWSVNQPKAWQTEEYFYYYDLINQFDKEYQYLDPEVYILDCGGDIDIGYGYKPGNVYLSDMGYSQSHLELYKVPFIEGLIRAREHQMKSLAYQKRTSGYNGAKQFNKSEYYIYKSRWEPEENEMIFNVVDDRTPTDPDPVPSDVFFDGTCQSIFKPNLFDHEEETPRCYSYYLYNNQYYICPTNKVDPTISGLTIIYQQECTSEDPMYGPSSPEDIPFTSRLLKMLFLSEVVIQIDTLITKDVDYGWQTKWSNIPDGEYILGWKPGPDFTNYNETIWEPMYPFDTLVVREVSKYNRHGLPVIERDVNGLETKYYYPPAVTNVHQTNSGVTVQYDFRTPGIPSHVTKGFGRTDSIGTHFNYWPDISIKSIIDANGTNVSFNYDVYGRLSESLRNNELLSRNLYHLYTENTTTPTTFDGIAAENYVETITFNNSGDPEAQWTRKWIDPTGNTFCSFDAVTNDGNNLALPVKVTYSGEIVLDNWDRPRKAYRAFDESNPMGVQLIPRFNSLNSNYGLDFAESLYENDHYGRFIRGAKNGLVINSAQNVKVRHSLVTAHCVMCELGLTSYEMQKIAPNWSGHSTFRKVEKEDEDGKLVYEYSNVFGQKVASAQFDNTSTFVTLFGYDEYGNLAWTSNPRKQVTTYEYNILGNLFRKTTPDGGVIKYMYNRAGQVVLEQDPLLKFGTSTDPVIPMFREYKYDIFGNLLVQQRRFQVIEFNQITDGISPLHYSEINDKPWTNAEDEHHYHWSNNMTYSWKATDSTNVWTTFDHTNYWAKTPVSVWDYLDFYFVKEKEFFYGDISHSGMPIFSSAENIINQQDNMIGRLNLTKTYRYDDSRLNSVQNPTEMVFHSYNNEGNLRWQIRQFNPNGITQSHMGIQTLLDYHEYDLRNNPLSTKIDVNIDAILDFGYEYEYDGKGRLEAVLLFDQINSYGRKIVQYEYDDRTNQVTTETYLPQGGCDYPGFDVRYQYDIRNRLTSINSPLFRETLYYDYNEVMGWDGQLNQHQNWNGNINGIDFEYGSSGFIVPTFTNPTNYGYSYDGLNRLIAADGSVEDLCSTIKANDVIGNATYQYDKVGNILQLTRIMPDLLGQSFSTSNWAYTYNLGNSKLLSISDMYSNQVLKSYSHDNSGNIQFDVSRGVNFVYGRANLPYFLQMTEPSHYQYSVSDQRNFKTQMTTNPSSAVPSTAITSEYNLTDGVGRDIGTLDLNTGEWSWYVFGNQRIARVVPTCQPALYSGDIAHIDYGGANNEAELFADAINQHVLSNYSFPTQIHKVRENGSAQDEYLTQPQYQIRLNNNATFHLYFTQTVLSPTQQFSFRNADGQLQFITFENTYTSNADLNRNLDLDEPGFSPENGFEYYETACTSLTPFSYYLYDHLGNTRVVFQFNSICEVETEYAADYYPYGKILREYIANDVERYLTTGNERDKETGYDFRNARFSDPETGRFLSVDPLAFERSWLTPYNYVQNNPILRTDPTGLLDGEYEKDKSGKWVQVSTKGDAIDVDFYHTDVLDPKGRQITIVKDREGNKNAILDGRKALAGLQRSENVNWYSIFCEWETGTGPATSFFEGNHPAIQGFKDHYLMNKAYNEFKASGADKGAYESGFGILDIIKTGGDRRKDAQAQMMGNYNISFYKLGDKILTLAQDSKSRSSLHYHLPFVQNYERGVHPGNQESTTRQNYLFFK